MSASKNAIFKLRFNASRNLCGFEPVPLGLAIQALETQNYKSRLTDIFTEHVARAHQHQNTDLKHITKCRNEDQRRRKQNDCLWLNKCLSCTKLSRDGKSAQISRHLSSARSVKWALDVHQSHWQSLMGYWHTQRTPLLSGGSWNLHHSTDGKTCYVEPFIKSGENGKFSTHLIWKCLTKISMSSFTALYSFQALPCNSPANKFLLANKVPFPVSSITILTGVKLPGNPTSTEHKFPQFCNEDWISSLWHRKRYFPTFVYVFNMGLLF